MTDWNAVVTGIAGSIIGGFIGGVAPRVASWPFRPKLQVDPDSETPDAVVAEDGRSSHVKYVRVRVSNKGRLRAKGCQAFLTALHEVRADGSMHAVLDDSKALLWAGGSGSPLDIPQRCNFYVDLLKVSEATPSWGIFGLFNGQQALQRYSGTYQFTVLVSGDNAEPEERMIKVEYKQDWHTLRVW